MNIMPINKMNTSFKGLLTISGPNKGIVHNNNDVVINTDNISTIATRGYLDKSEKSILGVELNNGAFIAMNNGEYIKTFLPLETVIDAYKKAETTGDYKLETKFTPIVTRLKGILQINDTP